MTGTFKAVVIWVVLYLLLIFAFLLFFPTLGWSLQIVINTRNWFDDRRLIDAVYNNGQLFIRPMNERKPIEMVEG